MNSEVKQRNIDSEVKQHSMDSKEELKESKEWKELKPSLQYGGKSWIANISKTYWTNDRDYKSTLSFRDVTLEVTECILEEDSDAIDSDVKITVRFVLQPKFSIQIRHNFINGCELPMVQCNEDGTIKEDTFSFEVKQTYLSNLIVTIFSLPDFKCDNCAVAKFGPCDFPDIKIVFSNKIIDLTDEINKDGGIDEKDVKDVTDVKGEENIKYIKGEKDLKNIGDEKN